MKYLFIRSALLILFVCIPFSLVASDSEWTFLMEKDGLKLYSGDTENSAFKTFRAVKEFDIPMEVIAEALKDFSNYKNWIPDFMENNLIKNLNENDPTASDYILHILFNAPWPVKNRDVVLVVRTKINWEKMHARVVLKSTNLFDVPLKKGVRRLKVFKGTYDLQYMNRNRTRVTYTSFSDPGGHLSPMMTYRVQKKLPYNTLMGLARVAKEKKYYTRAMKNYN